MRIQINGEQREFPQDSLFLNQLIDTLALPPQRIAVEVNRAIVRRSDWEKTKLKDGDQIEIVHFVGGGTTELSRLARAAFKQVRKASRKSCYRRSARMTC